MELKYQQLYYSRLQELLLIEPYGIEIQQQRGRQGDTRSLLIEPYGIEIGYCTN